MVLNRHVLMLDQTKTPILSALKASGSRPHAPFYAPGHKLGKGAAASLRDLMGLEALKMDLPELPELDNLFAPAGVIHASQDLAAEAFGADHTYFLANGSTCGIEAAILATCGPGDKIIVPRNAHRSVIAGLVLAGAMPVFVEPEYSPELGLALGISSDAIATALRHHPESRAVLLVSPTYHGICSDLTTIADRVHAHNIPLLVDEAHGAHFAFHPHLPETALNQGADLVVQSTHKVLGALSQASMLHTQGNRINSSRLQAALQLTQSTSPSYLLLASLDAARQQMATAGQQFLAKTLELSREMRSGLSPLTPVTAISPEDVSSYASVKELDLTRLTVDVSGLGMTGLEADEILHGEHGVTAELPELRHLTFIISLGNTPADGERFLESFKYLRASWVQAGAADPSTLQRLFRAEPPPLANLKCLLGMPSSPRRRSFPQRLSWVASVPKPFPPIPPAFPPLSPGRPLPLQL